MTPIDCACEKCKGMCAASTCLPTPQQARDLIRAGHGKRLATYQFLQSGFQFVGPAPAGKEGVRDLPDTAQGACTFFKDGGCELHGTTMKPLEGRLAHHTRPWLQVRIKIASHWRGKTYQSVLSALNK